MVGTLYPGRAVLRRPPAPRMCAWSCTRARRRGATVAVMRDVCQLALLSGASARSTGCEMRRHRRQALTAAAARTA